MSRAETLRIAEAEKLARRIAAETYLAEHGLALGQRIKVDGDGSAVFTIVGAGADGSITCNALGDGAFRSFRPDWCYPATRINAKGRAVPTTVPPDKRGLRDAWRLANGFGMLVNRTAADMKVSA
jgi:hypothetical protein